MRGDGRRGRVAATIGAALVVTVALAACEIPLRAPAETSQIVKVAESTTADGWRYEQFRNLAYPCSVSGYQTFVIGTRIGEEDPAVPQPLWVRMRGGGSGWFDEAGVQRPTEENMTEDGMTLLRSQLRQPGLVGRVLGLEQNFRGLAVSMCNRDAYGGANNLDPNNPHPDAEGNPRRTNGLLATKAAIQFTIDRHETTRFFLHGGSAGSAGSYHVSLALQRQGLAPAGIVADGGIRNDAWEAARIEQGICNSPYGSAEWKAAFAPRVHSELRDPQRQPHEMVTTGELTVPIVQVWTHGDGTTCGELPMVCPLESGPVVMGASDCKNEPLRAAIAAQGPTSRSLSLGVCVRKASSPPNACDEHVSTPSDRPNTNGVLPADYLALIVDWVEERLAETDEAVAGSQHACPWDPDDDRRHTFLLAGESDTVAVGANAAALPPEHVAGSDRLFRFAGGAWQSLAPVGAAAEFGPELSFAWTLLAACPDSEIGIVKHAAAGSTIATWTPGGANWSALFAQTAGALTSGVPVVLEGVVFQQGASDAGSLAAASGWDEQFVTMVAAARAVGAVPDDLPVLYATDRHGIYPDNISGIAPETFAGVLPGGAYASHLLLAQWDARDALPGLHPVILRDISVDDDGDHVTRSIRRVGRTFATTYLTVTAGAG